MAALSVERVACLGEAAPPPPASANPAVEQMLLCVYPREQSWLLVPVLPGWWVCLPHSLPFLP